MTFDFDFDVDFGVDFNVGFDVDFNVDFVVFLLGTWVGFFERSTAPICTYVIILAVYIWLLQLTEHFQLGARDTTKK